MWAAKVKSFFLGCVSWWLLYLFLIFVLLYVCNWKNVAFDIMGEEQSDPKGKKSCNSSVACRKYTKFVDRSWNKSCNFHKKKPQNLPIGRRKIITTFHIIIRSQEKKLQNSSISRGEKIAKFVDQFQENVVKFYWCMETKQTSSKDFFLTRCKSVLFKNSAVYPVLKILTWSHFCSKVNIIYSVFLTFYYLKYLFMVPYYVKKLYYLKIL